MTNEELDVQVAVEVMGWHWDDDWNCYIPPEQKAKPSEMWRLAVDVGRYVEEPIPENHVPGIAYNGLATQIIMPAWSSDIAAAWKVLERMTRPPRTEGEAIGMKNVRFSIRMDNACIYGMPAEQAARKICEAALYVMRTHK